MKFVRSRYSTGNGDTFKFFWKLRLPGLSTVKASTVVEELLKS